MRKDLFIKFWIKCIFIVFFTAFLLHFSVGAEAVNAIDQVQVVSEGGEVLEKTSSKHGMKSHPSGWPSTNQIIWKSFLIIFLVFLNGFFVAAEFALVKVRMSQIDTLLETGRRGALTAKKSLKNLDGHLSATQLGITFSSIALGFVGEPFINQLLDQSFSYFASMPLALKHSLSFILAYSFIAYLHVVLGELMPKSLAIARPVPTTLFLAKPLSFFYWLFSPAIYFLNGTANFLLRKIFGIEPVKESHAFHSAAELQLLVSESEKQQEVTKTEKKILINALELNDLTAKDIMTPKNDVVSLHLNKSFDENLKIARESKHTRFPLNDKDNLDSALGLIHIKDLISEITKDKPDLRNVQRRIEIVPELTHLDELLSFFLEKKAHLALVVNEYGGSVGIVTLDNVVAEIVGDIYDEFDDKDILDINKLEDDYYEIGGSAKLHEVQEQLGFVFEDDNVSTLSGFVTHKLGRVPKTGEVVQLENFEVKILDGDRKQVKKVRIKEIEDLINIYNNDDEEEVTEMKEKKSKKDIDGENEKDTLSPKEGEKKG